MQTTSSGGYVVISERRAILDVSPDVAARLGYTRDEMVGRCVDAVDSYLEPAALATLKARLKQGEAVIFDSIHRTKTGTPFPVRVEARPFTLDGELVVYAACVYDVKSDSETRITVDLDRLDKTRVGLAAIAAARAGAWPEELTRTATAAAEAIGQLLAIARACEGREVLGDRLAIPAGELADFLERLRQEYTLDVPLDLVLFQLADQVRNIATSALHDKTVPRL